MSEGGENSSFLNDISDFDNNTFPINIMKSTLVGIFCGVISLLYYSILQLLLESLWKKLPTVIFSKMIKRIYIDENVFRALWSMLVSLSCAIVCGSAQIYLGKPGDLNATIECVHKDAYIPTESLTSLVICSLATVVGAMSLGPEAPIVTICGMFSGVLSRRWFQVRDTDSCRRYVLSGMASGFSVFFGAPLGGSLFALEVIHRDGYEYFEHMIYAAWSGAISAFISLSISGRSFNGVWQFLSFGTCSISTVAYGGFFGLLGSFLAVLLGKLVKLLRNRVQKSRLAENPVHLALLGALGNTLFGLVFPQTGFWGEMEIQRIIRLQNQNWNYYFPLQNSQTMDNLNPTFAYYVSLGCAKFLCIAIAMTSNYRGGFIFPVMFVGVCFGRAFSIAIPQLSVETACLCCATGINVTLTRTVFGTPLVLAQLSNSMESFPAVFVASLVATCASHYYHFLPSQTSRSDMLKKIVLLY
ncbi:hypothetical protein GpartN1_g3859.t1 [Galdieria partita]|uniref:Chloride channel protein n=1 Tax=Galdieria partita TaxID=83374 RepID=A0A9C7UQP4_9RHOD|nr:hypothetical protein GpartN1_g3859.t1 [Galdieria partita]